MDEKRKVVAVDEKVLAELVNTNVNAILAEQHNATRNLAQIIAQYNSALKKNGIGFIMRKTLLIDLQRQIFKI